MSTHLKNSGFSTRNLIGIALIGIVLAVLPFVIGMAGQSWVRILNFALLYVMLSLGLNIVVGFAGLLDLGYIAFYAVGAYMMALLGSPHLANQFEWIQQLFPTGLHLSMWFVLPIAILVAATFGVLLKMRHGEPLERMVLRELGAMKVAQGFNPERQSGDLGATRMAAATCSRGCCSRAATTRPPGASTPPARGRRPRSRPSSSSCARCSTRRCRC